MGRPRLNHIVCCRACGVSFQVRSRWEVKQRRYCSSSCAGHAPRKILSGDKHPNWQGGKPTIDSMGYVRVWTPYGRMRQHVWVMRQHIGRPLAPGELVHHKNHDKTDNRIENLLLSDKKSHLYHHRGLTSKVRAPSEPNLLIKCACGCQTEFLRYDTSRRPRRFVAGHQLRR